MEYSTYTAGVDEAGRGPIAGPVIAAAVILDPAFPIEGLKDYKKMRERKRELLYTEIASRALSYAVGRAEVYEIDQFNILQATLLAMQRAIENLNQKPDRVLVDGTHCPKIAYPVEAIVKGDQKVAAISAASIVAKVTRDREVRQYEQDYPNYGFAQHKGYPTKAHLIALKKWGVTSLHRRSYRPVWELLDSTQEF